MVEEVEEMSILEAKAIIDKMKLSDKAAAEAEHFPGEGSFLVVIGVGTFSALGGGLFGLDIGYISGVESMESFRQDLLGGERMDSLTTGLVTGIFAVGAVCAAFPTIIGAIVDYTGRKGSIIVGGTVFCLGALSQGLSPSLTWMYAGRFVAGASVGLLSANIPIYQGEIAPPEYRGAIVGTYQLAITIGIMVAFWVNYGLEEVPHGWRISILLQLIPGGLLAVGGFFMPRSPRWLVSKKRYQEALDVLIRIRSKDEDVRLELAGIYKECRREMSTGKPTWKEMFSKTNGKVLAIGIVLQLIQQMCGLNLFMYYGPEVFEKVFHSPKSAFFFNALSGIVNFLSTFPALFLLDRLGRMTLLMYSAAGMAICCVILAVVGSACFEGPYESSCGDWAKYVVAGAVFFFIFNFAYGWGPCVWVYCAEIFSLKYKTKANGLTTDANWVGNFFIGFAPPWLMLNLGFKTFWIFAAVNILGTVAGCVLPETKGKTLEEVQQMFAAWFDGQDVPHGHEALCTAEEEFSEESGEEDPRELSMERGK